LSSIRKAFLVSLTLELLLCASVNLSFCSEMSRKEDSHFTADAAALYGSTSQVAAPAGADVIFLENQENLVFDTEGKVVRTRYLLYKVLTQKGVERWADVGAKWAPWHEERPVLRVRVITPDSTVHELDAGTITDSPANQSGDKVYSDQRVLRAPLPAVTPGALIEEEQVFRETAPFFGAGMVERFYFGSSVPVQHTRLQLDAPSSIKLRYEIRLMPDLKPQRSEADGRVRLVFDCGPIDPAEEIDPELPSDVPAYASVTFSTGASWQHVAAEYGKIVDAQLASADLKSMLSPLLAGKKSREEKISAILQHVDREVRYTGIEFGEATIVPRSPSETLTRKYGDCKDKAALLVAMLRGAGIPAYVALLDAGSREDVARDLPGIGMFDHAIVYLPGNPDFWIDATDEYARLGEVPRADQGRLALVAQPGSNTLTLTPVTSSADNLVTEKREIFLAENGPARIVETSQPHGSSESWYRRAYADKDDKRTKEELTNYVKSQYLAEKLDRMDRSDPHDLSKPFELTLEAARARRGATDLTVAAAAIRLEGLVGRLPADLRQREQEDDTKADKASGQKPKKLRTSDYELPLAFVTEWHYRIQPPPGFRPKPLPQDADLSLGPARLTEQFTTSNDGVVHALIRFDTVKRRMSVSEAHELRDKIVELLNGEAILIYFEPVGQTLLNAGKVSGALKAYRDLIALHPDEAVHHLQLAQAFLTAGLGEPARSEARAAVKLEPTSALAEKTLADILEYDSVGRRLRAGSDYAGAEAAYRAAISLDPDDKTNIANLAVLLEYNHWGLRYGPGAKLKEAIAEYRKLKPEKLTEFGMRANVSYDLFYDGQFAEARKSAETLNPQPSALVVACEAALNGSAAALTEARKRSANEQQFQQTVENAGQMLINLRRYSLGADLEEAGAAGQDASETVAYASLYHRTVPHEQIQFSDSPASVALRFELLTSDIGLTPDQVRSTASRNGAKVLATKNVVDAYVKEGKATLSRKGRKGDFADVGLDLSLTRAQPRVRGNDSIGYKVTLFPTANYKSAIYIVKEDGHYRILANSRFPAALGFEALDRIAANDLAGARALFDWLREDEHLAGGDDPLAGEAFPRFWTKGKIAQAAEMKLTAASILTEDKATAAQGIAILEADQDSGLSEAARLNRALALLSGYSSLDDFEKILSVCSTLAKQYPESKRVFYAQTYALGALGRFAEADRLATDLLKRIPDDADAFRAEMATAERREDYARARVLGQQMLDLDGATYWDLNNAAWNALFVGKVESAEVEDALKAAQLSDKRASILHTLGCLYAEVGKTQEAREVLIQAMDALDLDEPDDNYLYAFGRIAEQYGERDIATALYSRVAKPERPAEMPTSSYKLAQIRLQVLRGETH
jgi:transglutaminase-like putative cysteine protease/tetratricopeptide (TPR) repeat protein